MNCKRRRSGPSAFTVVVEQASHDSASDPLILGKDRERSAGGLLRRKKRRPIQ
jgi:hypothetical protein